MKDSPLARTFDEVSGHYHESRPTYPDPLFVDLVELAGLRESHRVLEIGCGTGQATIPLAKRGLEITCVELGDQLAAVGRRELRSFPKVEVIAAPFETWQPAVGQFDAVVAFTSLHWIDPSVRYAKTARLLRERGVLGIVNTHHVLPHDGDEFFRDVQADYEAVVPDDPLTIKGGPVAPEMIGDLSEEITASGLFDVVATRRYRWDAVYGAEEYVRLLGTYSNHRAFPVDVRHELLDRIQARIQRRPGMEARKSYLFILDIGRARPAG